MSRYREAVIAFKQRLITETLEAGGGNRTTAAKQLGLERTYLHRLIRTLGVVVPLTTVNTRRQA